MYTICTGCHRQFRILAEQLSAAHGQVKCGFCGQQFDALLHLSNHPIKPDQTFTKQTRAEQQEQTLDELESVLNERESESPGDENEIAENSKDEFEFSFDISEHAATAPHLEGEKDSTDSAYRFDEDDQSARKDSEKPDPIDDLSEEARATLESGKLQSSAAPQKGYEFPEELILEEPRPQKKRWPIVLWSLGSVFLLFILLAQYVWFQRDQLLQQYPQYYPYAIQLCETLGCDIQRVEKPDAIQVLNRDVRLHPSYRDTLLVNATIVNQETQPMRFPVIQLTLFNTVGEVISYRQFQPDDYLDQSIDKEQGMLPEQPIHFALEVTGEINNAVSFEFDFL